VKNSRCEDEKMWRWAAVKMRRCEDEKMWRWEDVKMRRCEDVRMWRWEGVKMRRCEDEQLWRWEDVKMRRCKDERMWRCEDVKMRRCEDEKMWRCADVKMRRCEDEKMWRWEDEMQTPTIGRTLRSDALGKKQSNSARLHFMQKWKVECRADGLVPMSFAIFPLHLSKALCLARKSEARSYEVLHLSRIIFLANPGTRPLRSQERIARLG